MRINLLEDLELQIHILCGCFHNQIGMCHAFGKICA